MSDLISRQAAIEEIQGFYPPKVANESEAEAINRVGWECAINCIEAYLRTVKPVDPVKHGKWERPVVRGLTCLTALCSVCGYVNNNNDGFQYCPNCGATMEGGKT